MSEISAIDFQSKYLFTWIPHNLVQKECSVIFVKEFLLLSCLKPGFYQDWLGDANRILSRLCSIFSCISSWDPVVKAF